MLSFLKANCKILSFLKADSKMLSFLKAVGCFCCGWMPDVKSSGSITLLPKSDGTNTALLVLFVVKEVAQLFVGFMAACNTA